MFNNSFLPWLLFKLQETDGMTYKLKKDFTKEELDKVLEKIAKKKKGIDMSKFAGKIKAFDKIDDVVTWQRRQRDDGTYNY